MRAILDGAQEIAVPAFVSTLCICIVFVPVAFITGAAKSLFVPLAMAVVFAMLTSYFLSRTLVPTMVHYLLARRGGRARERAPRARARRAARRMLRRVQPRLRSRCARRYGGLLALALAHRALVVAGVRRRSSLRLARAASRCVGRDFFPTRRRRADQAARARRRRARASKRPSSASPTSKSTIRTVIPPREIETMLDNIGTPYCGINLSLSEGALISPADGADPDRAQARATRRPPSYVRKLRSDAAPQQYPDTTFFFLAPDISTQVLNFGLAAPIDVQVVGRAGQRGRRPRVAAEARATRSRRCRARPTCTSRRCRACRQLRHRRRPHDGAAARASRERDVASDLLVSLSSSGQVAPSYWLDPKRGVQYLVAVQTPQYEIDSLDALERDAALDRAAAQPQLLSNVATVSRATGPPNITHYNVARTFDVQANVDGTDLGVGRRAPSSRSSTR